MFDVLGGLPLQVRSALADQPRREKALLELSLAWPDLEGPAAAVADRLRVFLLTWDPLDFLPERRPGPWVAVSYEEIACYLSVDIVLESAVDGELTVIEMLARACAPHRLHPQRSEQPPDPDPAARPAVRLAGPGWEPVGLGAIQDLVDEAFGPVHLDRSPVELSAPRLVEPSCPACAGRRFGFPADLHEHLPQMCPHHQTQAATVTTTRLNRAEQSNPQGWGALTEATRLMELPHLPPAMRYRVEAAIDEEERGVSAPEAGRRSARAAQELLDWFAGDPDGFSSWLDTAQRWRYIDWLMSLPLYLGHIGLVDQGVRIGDALAALDPEHASTYACDVMVALAEAGRPEQAVERIRAVLGMYPDQVWVWIHVGDTYAALGDPQQAESHFRKALQLAEDTQDPDGVLDACQRLLELLGAQQPPRTEDLRAVQRTQDQWLRHHSKQTATWGTARRHHGDRDPWPTAEGVAAPEAAALPARALQPTVRRETPKVRRNKPCPCGSGKKYKHCCGAR